MTALRNTLRNAALPVRARSLAVLASIIGRRHGVKVEFRSGTTAATDGKTIYLPMLSANATEEDAVLLEGLLDHEAMHCRFTDFAFMDEPDVQKALKKHPMVFPTFNTLEDVWGEREQSKVYPGCFRNIKKSIEVMIDRGLYGGRLEHQSSPSDAMRGYLLHGLLARLYENDRLEQFAQEHRANLVAFVGQKLTDEIWALAQGVDNVKSTQASFQLAMALFTLIEKELKKEPEESQRKPSLKALLAEAAAGGDIATMIEQALTDNGATDMDNNSVPELCDISSFRPTQYTLNKPGADLATLARPVAVRLGTKLEALLESRIEESTSFGRAGRRLQSRRVVGLSLGNLAVFSQKEESQGVDTAVQMLIDLSGSMFVEPRPCHLTAKIAAHSVGDVLDRSQIPFAITAFGSQVCDVKNFDEPWRSRKASLDLGDLGSTLTAEALAHVAQRMTTRQENRRLLILVTDGEADENVLVIPAMNELAQLNLEFACIFIGYEGRNLECKLRDAGYPVQRVTDVDSLPQVIFTAIQNAI